MRVDSLGLEFIQEKFFLHSIDPMGPGENWRKGKFHPIPNIFHMYQAPKGLLQLFTKQVIKSIKN